MASLGDSERTSGAAGGGGRSPRVSVWRWPVLLAALSLFGLLSALLGQGGIWWVLSWMALAAPLIVIVRCLWRGSGRRLAPAVLVLIGLCAIGPVRAIADSPAVGSVTIPAGQAAGAYGELPANLSPWSMFVSADVVVKIVIIGLAFASVATWTALIAKSLELARALRRQRAALAIVDQAATLAEAARQIGTGRVAWGLVEAAEIELKLSAQALEDREAIKERVASRLEWLEAAAGRRMIKGTGVLATIGATAPFVGLFGTVWGIMNSFVGISRLHATNLAVVAPGIAEALLATAAGLAAAIPAVVIYNHFARQIVGYKALVAGTSAAVMRLLSRDLSIGGPVARVTLRSVRD